MTSRRRVSNKFFTYTYSRSFSWFLGLIFVPETTLEKALNIRDICDFSSIVSESNPCPKNLENDWECVYQANKL